MSNTRRRQERARPGLVSAMSNSIRRLDVVEEDVLENAAVHPDRKRCLACGRWRALKRRSWASISATTDGPKWVFLWRCACGSDAFDHAEGS